MVNVAAGGFSLSPEAVRRGRELGASWARWPRCVAPGDVWPNEMSRRPLGPCDIYPRDRFSLELRSDPILIRVVKELGAAAGGPHATLAIIDVPDGAPQADHVVEFDGLEIFP